MGTAPNHFLFVLAGVAVMPGQQPPANPNAMGFVSEFLLTAYVLLLILGAIIVFFALRGRKDKGGVFAPPFPGRNPSNKQALRGQRRQKN